MTCLHHQLINLCIQYQLIISGKLTIWGEIKQTQVYLNCEVFNSESFSLIFGLFTRIQVNSQGSLAMTVFPKRHSDLHKVKIMYQYL